MTPSEVTNILRQFNEWRRGDEDIPQFDVYKVGEAIDAAVEMIDRLEAAEKSDAESIAMYRKARDERDALRTAVRHEADCVEAAMAEIKSLRAKVEAMEKQEPVAWCATDETGTVVEALSMNQSRRFDTPLGFLPGAKGDKK